WTVVSCGDAGRMLRSVVRRADRSPEDAANVSDADPNDSRALILKATTVSEPSDTLSVSVDRPMSSTCLLAVSDTVIRASGPEPSATFATPTETASSSPGAAKVGTFGESTNGARTSVFFSATPTASGATATAITRSAPLKESGTSKEAVFHSGPESTMPDQK